MCSRAAVSLVAGLDFLPGAGDLPEGGELTSWNLGDEDELQV